MVNRRYWEPWSGVGDDSVTIDLHGYRYVEGVAVGAAAIEEAWRRGFRTVELIHGKSTSRGFRRAGTIKWGLRGLLLRGWVGEYTYYRRSVKHDIRDGSMTLALKPNPSPIGEPFPALSELEELAQEWHWCIDD